MSSKQLRTLLKRLAGFYASSFLGTLVDSGVLWLCADCIFDGTYWGENIVSPLISFECAVLFNFICSYFYIWKDRISARDVSSFGRHYLAYNLSCTGVFCVKMLFLLLFKHLLGWHVVLCNLLALCVSGALNFLMNECVIFRRKKLISKN